MWNATVPKEAAKLGQVRHAAERHLQAAGVRCDIDEIVLMISELITNALRHGEPPARISVNADPERVLVAVSDGSDEPPKVLPVEPTRIGGNGMRIVETFATRWGFDPLDHGKAVWFEVLAG